MSLASVKAFFLHHAPDIDVLETEVSSATVADAARAHHVPEAQIAKTLCFIIKDEVVLVVMSGDMRLDNRKFKEHFGAKAVMADAQKVVAATSHPVGGICPFGLPAPLAVYCDVSLKRFMTVYPAAGSTHAAVCITPQRLAALTHAHWLDVGKPAC